MHSAIAHPSLEIGEYLHVLVRTGLVSVDPQAKKRFAEFRAEGGVFNFYVLDCASKLIKVELYDE